MANPLRNQIQVKLDKNYKARLTIDAIMQIEDAVGCGIIKLAQNMAEGDIRMTHLINVLTPALRGGGNDLQENDVKKIVQKVGIVSSTNVVAEILMKTLEVQGGEEDATPEKKE
jgi:hypothetical protein